MNEDGFGSKVRQALNEGPPVDDTVARRLRAARELALERQRLAPATGLAWADNVLGRLGGWPGIALRIVLPLLILLALVFGGYSWQQSRHKAQLEEIDVQLLTDDLPIDAYLDRGFQNWLKKRRAGY
jgi:hypothetical protein